MIFLILLFAVFYLYLACKRLDWAVLLMIAALPSYLIRFKIFGIPSTLLEVMILVAFAVWLLTKTNFRLWLQGKYGWKDLKENRLKREKYPWRWEIIAVLVVSWTALAIAGFSNSALGIWKAYFLEPILVFILVLNVFKTGKGLKNIYWALSISAFCVSALAIFQKITGLLISNPMWAAAATRRVVSFFGYPNAVGLYLGPIIMILIGYFFSVILTPHAAGEESQVKLDKTFVPADQRFFTALCCVQNDNVKKAFVGATIVLSLLSIAFARSEGAMLGIAAAFFVFGILAGKKIRWATFICALVISGSIMAYKPVRTHVLDLVQLHNFSGQVRVQQWKETWKMLSDGRFLLGAGLANYQQAVKPYHQEGIFIYDFHDPDFHRKLVFSDELKKKVWQPLEIYLYPHNILLNFWTELGLAGMILFVLVIGKFLVLSFKVLDIGSNENNYLALGLMCAMIVIVVHGLVDVPYFKNDLSILFWLILGMQSLVVLGESNKNK